MIHKNNNPQNKNILAIISIETHFGGTESLETFEKALFKRENHLIPIPPNRQNPDTSSILGGFLPRFEWNSETSRIPSMLVKNLPIIDQLLLEVSFGALARIGFKLQADTADRLAVIVIRDQHTNHAEDSAHLEQWIRSFNYAGPLVDYSYERKPIQSALIKASEMLEVGIDKVLIAAASYYPNFKESKDISADNYPGEGAGAIVVSRAKKIDSDHPIFALIDTYNFTTNSLAEEHSEVLEFCGNPSRISSLSEPEMTFSSDTQPNCALGSLQSQFGNFGKAAPLASLIKTALSLSTRSIYASEHWISNPSSLQSNYLYIPEISRPWFDKPSQNQRSAAVWHLDDNQKIGVFYLWDVPKPAQIKTLSSSGNYLIPISSNSLKEIQLELDKLEMDIENGLSLNKIAKKAYLEFKFHPSRKFVLSIIGSSKEEILNEIKFAKKGVPSAFEKEKDWQTPNGSYFSPKPLGETGKIAFVYPGAFSSYPGLGKGLFHLFPMLFDQFKTITEDAGSIIKSDLLYPKKIAPLSEDEKNALENQLNNDPISMLTSGTGIAFLYTTILREVFKLQADAAFGYSLGENSMMFAAGIWNSGDQAHQRLENSPLFKSRLAGEQKAIREYWQKIGKGFCSEDSVWANYVLMSPLEKVEDVIDEIGNVFVTHINTPRQIVIGGDPESCKSVIDKLKCMHLEAPYNYAIHCDAMTSEYNIIADLHRWPINEQSQTSMYTAATYKTSRIDSEKISQNIAKALCSQLDFPKLTNKVYQDGARIFIEMGAGSNCAKWIDANLRGKPHLSTSINRMGTDDDVLIFQLIAKLISHKVKLDIRSLYK